MTLPLGSDYFELADYTQVLKRRWGMILVFTIAGIVLAGAYYFVTPKTYASTVLIQVNALPTNANALGGRTGGPINMDNEAQIVKSATVGTIAQSTLHSSLTVAALLKDIQVAVPPNTTFLQVTCDAASPDAAQRCANAFGRAYLYNRRVSELNLLTSGIKGLNTQATSLETGIEVLRAKLGKGGYPHGSPARGIAKLQLSAKVSGLATIQAKISAVTPLEASLTARNNFVGQVVTPAGKSAKPVSPKKKVVLPSGLAGGLIIGLVFAYFWDWRRPRIRTARDVRRKVSAGTVIALSEVRSGTQNAFAPPRSRTGQAFTELAQHVGNHLGDGAHVVLVAGTSAVSGGGTAAANLAGALARSRGETVLICADPAASTIPRLLGAADGRGFAEVLADTATLTDVTRRTADLPLLRVITPGLDAASAVYDMQYDKVQRLMRELRKQVRYVVIDVPSPAADADTFSLAEFADGAVIVVESGVTHPDDLVECADRLEDMHTPVLGAVVLPAGARPAKRGSRGRRAEYIEEPPARYQQPRPAPMPEPAQQLVQHQPVQHHPVQAPVAQHRSQSQHSQPVQPPSGRTSSPYPASNEQNGTSRPPVIRPVSRPSDAATSSRHAAPGHVQPDQGGTGGTGEPQGDSASLAGFSSSWKTRSVGETWPLPRTALSEQDEEPDDSDPLTGI